MISIRNAVLSDLPVVHNLARLIWPASYRDILSPRQLEYMLEKIYSLSSLQNQLLNLQHNFILADDKEVPVGFASFSAKEKDKSTYRLHKIYVMPQQQGTGTGKLLLNHIIVAAKSSGANSLELNVNRYNRARLFYEKQGFIIIGEEDIDIGEGFFMNDYIMKLSLQ